jgi:hypothetical protein
MVIGFCTSCMNRRWQVEATLARNLATLRGTGHFLALANYNSTDGLDEYVRENHQQDQREGTLLYFRTTTPTRFDASIAKNLAHRLAMTRGPDVLFNLDADNFVTAETLSIVVRTFAERRDRVLHQWSTSMRDGSFGRIGMAVDHWKRIGGYDETLQRMAWQDMDLLNRARAVGLQYRHESQGIEAAIRNSYEQKLANVGEDWQQPGERPSHAYKRLVHENMMAAFCRPVIQDIEQQSRFSGLINHQSEATV